MKDKIINILKNPIFSSILFSAFACIIFNLSMTMVEQKTFYDTAYYIINHFDNFFKSYILMLLSYFILLSFGRFFIPSLIIGASGYIFALVNFYKIQYRAEPLLPWDIFSFGEAAEVVTSLKLSFPIINIVALLITVIVIVISFKKKPINFGEGKKKLVSVCAVIVCSVYCFSTYYEKAYAGANEWPDTWFRIDYYKNNGLLNSFIYNFRYLSIDAPSNYSKETMNKISEGLLSLESSEDNNFKPDIIFIMSESFWDPQTLNGITYEEELLPNLKALQSQGLSGQNLSPKFGGGTSNVEYEALTGFSNDYLPDGCIPYQQYVTNGFFSIVDYLKNRGYDTLAIHSDEGKNWNREKAYKNMGFDDYISLEDMENPEITRGRVSDREITKYIIDNYEKHIAESDAPWFNFIVTMQNHTGYDVNNFTEEDRVKFTSENPLSETAEGQLSDFSTGVHISDEELGKIADYFMNQERPVILIFFGDHRVNLGSENREIYYATNTITEDMTEAEKQYTIHTTPIMAISNFSDETKDFGVMAPYMILPSVLETYGVDMPVYFDFLNTIREKSTGAHLNMTLDENGIPLETVPEDTETLYNILNMIQYDYIIGDKYINSEIFK